MEQYYEAKLGSIVKHQHLESTIIKIMNWLHSESYFFLNENIGSQIGQICIFCLFAPSRIKSINFHLVGSLYRPIHNRLILFCATSCFHLELAIPLCLSKYLCPRLVKVWRLATRKSFMYPTLFLLSDWLGVALVLYSKNSGIERRIHF